MQAAEESQETFLGDLNDWSTLVKLGDQLVHAMSSQSMCSWFCLAGQSSWWSVSFEGSGCDAPMANRQTHRSWRFRWQHRFRVWFYQCEICNKEGLLKSDGSLNVLTFSVTKVLSSSKRHQRVTADTRKHCGVVGPWCNHGILATKNYCTTWKILRQGPGSK